MSNAFADAINSAVNAVKSIDVAKIKRGLDNVQTVSELASAAFEKPEIALAGLLKTFAKRAMDTDLGDAGARDLAKVVIRRIQSGKKGDAR